MTRWAVILICAALLSAAAFIVVANAATGAPTLTGVTPAELQFMRALVGDDGIGIKLFLIWLVVTTYRELRAKVKEAYAELKGEIHAVRMATERLAELRQQEQAAKK